MCVRACVVVVVVVVFDFDFVVLPGMHIRVLCMWQPNAT